MEYSESCDELVKEIQKRTLPPWMYALMIMTFIKAHDDGETNKMALALAKQSVEPESPK